MWKSLPMFNNEYEVSNFGHVRRSTISKNYRWKSGYIRKPQINNSGYLCVVMPGPKIMTIHKLVMLTFCGSSNLEINHIDGNKLNNRLDNLEYVSSSENKIHAHKNGFGFIPNSKGSLNGRAILTEKKVYYIKLLLSKNTLTQVQIAKKLGVSRSTISAINTGRIWS